MQVFTNEGNRSQPPPLPNPLAAASSLATQSDLKNQLSREVLKRQQHENAQSLAKGMVDCLEDFEPYDGRNFRAIDIEQLKRNAFEPLGKASSRGQEISPAISKRDKTAKLLRMWKEKTLEEYPDAKKLISVGYYLANMAFFVSTAKPNPVKAVATLLGINAAAAFSCWGISDCLVGFS